VWIFWFLLIFLSGCATTGIKQPREELFKTWPEHRPRWITKEPYRREGKLFFVGLSGKFSLEKEAREDALRDAINKVVSYIGVEVKTKFENIQTSYGLSSEIIDPTRITREFEEYFSKAVARRVKAKEWYIQKYRLQKKRTAETFYMVYVLAFVPEKEVSRTINKQIKEQEQMAKFLKEFRDVFGRVIKNPNFSIEVFTDRGKNAVYKKGETFKVKFRTERDSFVYLFYTDAENNVTLLFPNKYNKNNFVKADREYSIPDESMNFKFTVREPFGTEVIKAVACLERVKELDELSEKEIFPYLGKIDSSNVRRVASIISNIRKSKRAESMTVIKTIPK